MISLMRQLFGSYAPIGVDGVNFEYVGAVVFLIVVVFCIFKLIGTVISKL